MIVKSNQFQCSLAQYVVCSQGFQIVFIDNEHGNRVANCIEDFYAVTVWQTIDEQLRTPQW